MFPPIVARGSVAVTFRAQAKNERGENQNYHALFRRRKKEFLLETIELETPALFYLTTNEHQ
jgi:hypothetical protein